MEVTKRKKQKQENPSELYTPPKDSGQLFIEELGYKQINERKLGIFDLIFFNVCFIQSSQIIFQFIGAGLSQNSPCNMIVAYLIIMVFNIIIAATVAEIVSAYPSCGSFYTVTFLLSPKAYCQQISVVCGYLIYFGNLQLVSTLCIEWFEQIQLIMSYMGYEIQDRNFIIIGSLITGMVVNLLIFSLQGFRMQIFIITSFIAIMLFFIISLIFLWNFSPGYSNSDIIFQESSEFGLSNWNIFLIFKLWIFSQIGQGVCVNISEETVQPQNIQGKSILISYLITSLMGLATLLTFVYAINIQSIADYTQMIQDNTTLGILRHIFTYQSLDGDVFEDFYSVTIIMCVSIMNLFFMIVITNVVVIKQQFALIRDGAYPASKYIYNKESQNYNIIFIINFFFVFIIQIISIYSKGTRQLLINSYTLMITLTYLFPIVLKMATKKNDFKKHKFDLGKFSKVFGFLSIIFLTFECCMLCLPNDFEDDANYSILYLLGFIVFTLFMYYCPKYGLIKRMQGPIRWDDKFGHNKKKKTNFQKVQELYALVENGQGRFTQPL